MLNYLLNVLNLSPTNFHTTFPLANTVLCRCVIFLPVPEHIIPICSMLFLLQRNPSTSLSDKILLFQVYRILSPPGSIMVDLPWSTMVGWESYRPHDILSMSPLCFLSITSIFLIYMFVFTLFSETALVIVYIWYKNFILNIFLLVLCL